MNTTEQIQQAVVELLTPIERTLGACAENRVLASAACDQLRQAIHSLEDAADDDWCLCSRTLANLLEIVGCFADGPDSLEEESAEEIIEFVQSTLPSLRQSLAGEAAAGDVAMRELVEEARARWGEYLTLVEGDGFLAGRALDTELSVDGESDVEETGQRDSSSEQVELILSAVKELSAGARTAGSQSFPVESTGSAAAASTSSDSFFKRRSHTALPAPPAAPQAIPLSEILREAYLEDAEQCLSSMERAVMAFENDSRAQAPIDQLCRDLHTLKGASASIGLSELATYLHEIEEWLPASNANERAGRLQPILDCVDFVRLQIAALKPPGLSSGPGKPNEPVAAHRPLTDVTSGAERSTEPGEETIRVRSSQLDRMMNLLVELVIWRRRRDRRVAELGESGDELSRCVRRLESLAKGYSLSRTSYDSAMPRGSLAADETTRESSKSLGEITSDLREIAGSLRDCRQSMTEENRAVSQFIQQFRQQLAQASRVPLSGLFQRLQRVVREAARLESKQVRLEYVGQNTGLERSLQERLYEPLLHLVRNAVCHGIEPADKRNRTGKPPVGTITLEASGNSQMLVLDVRDDGGGLDFDAIRRRGIERGLLRPDEPVSPNELSRLIFHPGFSTRAQANEVAGRGVGMDVVLTALNRCHCQIEVHSEAGIGTTFRLSIPLPSVIEHSLVFRCGGQLFGLPMQFVMSTSLGSVPSGLEAKALPGSCVELQQVLRLDRPAPQSESRSLCLGSNLQSRSASPNDKSGSSTLHAREHRWEFLVEDILGPEEVVVRPLPPLLRRHPVLSGVTLSGAGEVVLLLDGPRLLKVAAESSSPEPSSLGTERSPGGGRRQASAGARPRILIAEDSLSARRRLVEKFLKYGFEITEASDGLEALSYTRNTTFDAVFSDLEMPGLNGFELLTAIKNDPRALDKPVVIVTSRDEPETKAKALELGADAFLAKPVSDAMIEALLDQLAITPEM